MTRPVVGIIGNAALLNDSYPTQAAGEMNIRAIAEVSGCMPLVIPSQPD